MNIIVGVVPTGQGFGRHLFLKKHKTKRPKVRIKNANFFNLIKNFKIPYYILLQSNLYSSS